jgi:O-antigen ligase
MDQDLFCTGVKLYLLISGVLMFMQVNFGGGFYLAGFLGKLDFGPSSQAWGFADGHILAGGILAWMLSLIVARYTFGPKRNGSVLRQELVALAAVGLGVGGLLYTLSRGAWLGFATGMFAVSARLLFSSEPRRNFIKAAAMIITSALFFYFLPHRSISHSESNLGDRMRFLVNVSVRPRAAVVNDASVNTRMKAWGVAIVGIRQSPFWGIGISQYQKLYEKFFSSFVAANAKFDPNPKQTPCNSYFFYAVEAGMIPALGLFVLISVILIQGLSRGGLFELFPFVAGLIAVCAWIFTCDFINERIFWIALGSVAGLSSAYKRQPS